MKRTLAAVLAVLALALTAATSSAPAAPAATSTGSVSAGQVAAVLSPPPATLAAARTGTYTARAGDTLWRIAALYCATGRAYPSLAAASGITNPDRIRIGQVITLNCAAAVGHKPIPPTPAGAPAKQVVRPATLAAAGPGDSVASYARAQVGRRYVFGTAGPGTFDCSGLVVAAYARLGVRLPHQSEQLLAYGRPVARTDLRPGDVVWPFHGHVMIYVGNGQVVEAANPQQGVRLNTLYAFMTARRFS